MHEIDRALAEISNIRAQLATSTQFRGFTPEMLVYVAVIFAAVTVAQTLWPEQLARNDISLVATWGGLHLVTTAAAAAEAMIRAKRLHGGMALSMWRSAMQVLGSIGAAATIITVNIALYAPEAIWLAPGIWLILIGLVGVAFQRVMPHRVWRVALFYILLGTIMLSIAGEQGHLTPSLIGIPLVLGNFATALILHNAPRKPSFA